MAKRFTDTDKWKKRWFRQLKNDHKVFWVFLLDQCDHAGIWEVDFELASWFCNGIKESEIRETFVKQYHEFDNGKRWFLKDFIEFQYNKLNDKVNAHKSVLVRLNRYNLLSIMNGNEQFINSSSTVKDKDKDKDKVKDKEKAKETDKERELKFIDFCKAIYKQCEISDVMLVDFVNYWTEMNPDGNKMRFEMEKVFDHKRRLLKWKSNNKKWEKPTPTKKQTFESKFNKTKTGLYLAYCSRCGKKEMPNDAWQLKDGSNCCRVEYTTEKPNG